MNAADPIRLDTLTADRNSLRKHLWTPPPRKEGRTGQMTETGDIIRINRAPVLTLWAAVVAERLGLDRATALCKGECVQAPKDRVCAASRPDAHDFCGFAIPCAIVG